MTKSLLKQKKIDNPLEILSHISMAALKTAIALVWRRAHDKNLEFNEKGVVLKITSDQNVKLEFDKEVDLKTGEEVYFALEDGTLVFRTNVIDCVGKRVTLLFPRIAKGVERRKNPRTQFKYDEKIDLQISYCNGPSAGDSTAYLLNLSEGGMCLALSEETARILEIDQVVSIVRSNKNIGFTKCIVRSIRVFKPATMGRNALYAVGFQFK